MPRKPHLAFPLALALLATAPGHAQISLPSFSAPATAAPGAPSDPYGRTTPKGTVLGFLQTAQTGDYTRAASYLETNDKGRAAAELARQLYAVLDHDLIVNLDKLSDNPQGAPNDSLPPDRERIGAIAFDSTSVDILLSRVSRPGGPVWLFSSGTLAAIPELFNDIDRPAFERHLPALLQIRTHLFSLRLWQLLIFLLAVPISLLAAHWITRLLTALLKPLVERIARERAQDRLNAIAGPVRLIVLVLMMRAETPLLTLPILARQYWIRAVSALAIAAIVWLLLRLIEVASQLTINRLIRTRKPSGVSVVHLVRRLVKAIAVGLAALLILRSAGIDLTPVLAGVSVAGIAIAFAAQKTLENLFGGIMIITDEPIRAGDFCRFGGQTGTVEDIGLRSTRFRTNERTIVAVPNGQLAIMNLENFSVRDKFLFNPTLTLRCETSADQLRYVLAEVRRLLYAHSKVETSSARVRFVKLGDSSFNLEVFSYAATLDFNEFLAIQEDLLLRIMDIVAEAGSDFAFPSQTLYFGRDKGLDPAKSQAAADRVRQWKENRSLPFPDFAVDEISGIENRIEYPPPDSARRENRD